MNSLNCNELLKEIPIVNRNAARSAAEYKLPTDRLLHQYESYLGDDFKKGSQKEGHSRLLDIGGGLGMAGLQKSNKPNQFATVINAQDFWNSALKWKKGEPLPFDSYRIERIIGSLNIKHDDLFYIDKWMDRPRYAPGWEEIAMQRIQDHVTEKIKQGKFDYQVGFAEVVLPKLADSSFDQLSDVFGGYYYSGSRVELIDQYYKKLSENGEGYVVFYSIDYPQEKPPNAHGPISNVLLKNGETVPLETYLSNTFPTTFEVFETGSSSPNESIRKVLRIKKNSKQDLDITSRLELVSTSFPKAENDFKSELPTVVYRER